MELELNGRIIEAPKPADITAAIDGHGGDPDWFVNLGDDDGDVEAFLNGDGSFRLSYHDGKDRFTAPDPVDAATLKTILLAALRGELGWRRDRAWLRQLSPKKAAEAAGEPPVWAIAAVIASVALIFLVTNLPDSWLERLPVPNTTLGTIGLIALPMAVMVLAMVAHKAIQLRRAKSWLPAQGRITSSRMATRRSGVGEDATIINIPAVAYSFSVGGRSYQGGRLSIGDISGPFAEEALARYPVGTAVTVYYDPADPENCVLERDAPKGAVKGCGAVLLVLALLGGGGYWAFTQGQQTLQASMPQAEVPVMLFAFGFGCAALLFFLAYRRHLARANAWPVVSGRVTESRVEQRSTTEDGRTRTSYAPVVEFTYQVRGHSFSSRQIALGMQISGSQGSAEKLVDRYPAGAEVEVHYDPANPSQAALENPTGASWILLGIALFCFGVALYASHIFR
ncbi:DUF3592 domain-containing protein [Bosea psychrotolerans]|uniref:Uncharacterized protein DUF3592 n=1 Tax=Bosea psychrotolerans TaxID=1871628 RepID=A0A2S4MQK1_9HYPH|nr:DUF3592 domain-containing protein [Bosea psychrotolerans]POR57050.1 uncharacterized protein DUF3592 [Bosea psychrotolerans]